MTIGNREHIGDLDSVVMAVPMFDTEDSLASMRNSTIICVPSVSARSERTPDTTSSFCSKTPPALTISSLVVHIVIVNVEFQTFSPSPISLSGSLCV